jgi:hypothetical protein
MTGATMELGVGDNRKITDGVPAMNLLDEIIDLAAGEQRSVATLLRKCLVLAHALRNDRLKVWAENELNGYAPTDDGIPEYRKTAAPAKGIFMGGFGAQINDQPIPPALLQERHRHFAESAVLRQLDSFLRECGGGFASCPGMAREFDRPISGGLLRRRLRIEQGMAGNSRLSICWPD